MIAGSRPVSVWGKTTPTFMGPTRGAPSRADHHHVLDLPSLLGRHEAQRLLDDHALDLVFLGGLEGEAHDERAHPVLQRVRLGYGWSQSSATEGGEPVSRASYRGSTGAESGSGFRMSACVRYWQSRHISTTTERPHRVERRRDWNSPPHLGQAFSGSDLSASASGIFAS